MINFNRIVPIAVLFVLSGCMQKNNNIEDTDFDSSKYIDDTYIDTISVINGKVLGWRYDDGIARGLFYSNRVITDDLSVKVEGGPEVFEFCIPGKRLKVDFTDPDITKKLKEINLPLKGFTRFKDRYTRDFGSDDLIADFKICVDIPENQQIEDNIEKLLINALNEHSPMGYMTDSASKALLNRPDIDIKDLARSFFNEYNKKVKSMAELITTDVYYIVDVRAINVPSSYITFKVSLRSYDGGAHGMYNIDLISYDLTDNSQIDNLYLFNEKDLGTVKKMLVEKIMSDPAYRANGFARNKDQLRHMVNLRKGKGKVTNGAISEDGIVFIFQPYEIAPYSEGTFYYTLPYDDLKPYMTEKALDLVSHLM